MTEQGSAFNRADYAAAQLFDLSGRPAVITGGASGLGRAIAEVLHANGAQVVIADCDAERLAALREEWCEQVTALQCDIRDDAAIARLFDEAAERVGPVSVVVNAAGTARRGPALELERRCWQEVHAVNVESAFAVATEGARRMIAAGRGGSIINVASFLHARPMRNVAAYAASKAAVHQMTRSLALEWARHGIRVNEIVPGWFPTPMTAPFLAGRAGDVLAQANPLHRLGRPADLAGAVLLLASDAGAYMTGASLAVDGGQGLA